MTEPDRPTSERDSRLLALEQEVNALCLRQGEAARYPLARGAVPGVDATSSRQKQTYDTLQQNDAFSRSIIESSSDCIKVLDLDGNLLSLLSGQKLLGIKDIHPL